MRHAIVVMTRAPRAGAVKTRLAATLGDARALAIHRALVQRTLAAALESRVHTTVCVAPGEATDEMRRWLGSAVAYEPQPAGDLGARMAAAIRGRVAEGADAVVVIGTDCPTITDATLHAAFAALEDADVVFGPASDGGYYLVGMRDPHDGVFAGVPWSSDRTLAVSMENAERLALRVALLEEMRDVDTEDDWRWHLARSAMSP